MEPPVAMRVLAVLLCAVIVSRMLSARRGRQYSIRRLAGIDALEDAIGTATETGRPVLFSPGIGALDNMQVLAGLAVLGWVARRCVKMGVRLVVAIAEPVVIAPATDILKEAFRAEDASDRFSQSDVAFFGRDQNAFAAGVIGLIEREQVATGLYFGNFGFESLLIAETGSRRGAVQVAATADFFQIPFFLCACDYTLIGEELYAASAYLSREPVQVGTVAGQDVAKIMLMLLLCVGVGAAIFGTVTEQPPSKLNFVEGLLGK